MIVFFVLLNDFSRECLKMYIFCCVFHLIQTRKKVLIPAFSRSLRDPFPPARGAGIMSISATQEYYSAQEIATKLLPALCCLTIDPDEGVRENVSIITLVLILRPL